MTAGPFTADRMALAVEVAQALGWRTAAPADQPTTPGYVATGIVPNVVPPCAVVIPAPDTWAAVAFGTYACPLEVWLFAHALDLQGLETHLAAVLVALGPQSTCEAPGPTTWGQQTFLAAKVTVPRHVALEGDPAT